MSRNSEKYMESQDVQEQLDWSPIPLMLGLALALIVASVLLVALA